MLITGYLPRELAHYENTPIYYIAIFHCCKNVNFHIIHIFAQNIDRKAVLTSTHNLCFGAKIRK